MLHEFLSSHREELIFRCRRKVAQRQAARTTGSQLAYGIPVFLTQLTGILREESSDRESKGASGTGLASAASVLGIEIAAVRHGNELLLKGYTVDQVVHDYGDLCQAITELAIELEAPITIDEFHSLNRCLDNAIADAVSAFAREHDRIITDASEHAMNERLGFLAHEFRNHINTAMLALNVIRQGKVGMAGSTGAILDRSLIGLHNLCSRALVDVRLSAGIPQQRERVLVSEFIEEAHVYAAIDATAREIDLIVPDVEAGLLIEVDRQVLAGAVTNLLQNAFKFTKARSRVWLRSFSSADRVLIEVEDECGGLPPGNTAELFKVFEQRGGNRSGLGLGLDISRRSVEANAGKLHVRDIPGRGCVFTIDLPKAAVAKSARV